MCPSTLLPDPKLVQLDYVASEAEAITLVVQTIRPSVPCPDCLCTAQRVHSRYWRTLADLPWNGVRVRLRLHSRRFFCDHRDCPRAIFTERLPGLAERYARRTVALTEVLQLLGFAIGGEAGARLAAALGLKISPSGLLTQLRRQAASTAPTPRVLGVDDFAFRKGVRYGTLLVDLERGCPIELLPDRRAETLAAWLKEHPGVEIVTRDRSAEFAKGITAGAPDAAQVADRFHLLVNLREMCERVVERHRHRLPGIVLPQTTRGGNTLATVASETRGRQPARCSPSEEATRTARYERRQALRQQVHDLHEAGETILGISQRLDLNRSTVYRYLRQPPASGATRTRSVRSGLDAHLAYLSQRWAEGCQNAQQLWREIQERGYEGSRKMVAVWAQHQRETPAPTTPQKYRVASTSAAAVESPSPDRGSAPRLPSTRRLTWFLWREATSLSVEERETLQRIHAAAPDLALLQPLIHEFQSVLRKREVDAFHTWRERALASGLSDLQSFVNGLERDQEAIEAAIRLPWSNGPVEGQVNRLKLLKRQMYGRAKFPLLRARVLQAV
jgi:transposase